MEIGKRLEEIAKVFGVSNFATMLGMKQMQDLYPYFKGKSNPGKRFKEKLENLGISSKWIEYGEGSPFADNEAGHLLKEKFGEKFAEKFGVENGQIKLPDYIKSIREFDFPKDDILVPKFVPPVPAGEAKEPSNDYNVSYLNITKLFKDSFIIDIIGNSMINAGIEDGDELVMKKCDGRSYRKGDIILARIGIEYTIKYVENGDGYTLLTPGNIDFEPRKITPDMDFECVGILERIMSKPKPMRIGGNK